MAGGVVLLAGPGPGARAQSHPTVIVATADASVQAADAELQRLFDGGTLEVRGVDPDPLVPGRRHERLHQLHRGVPVVDGAVTRQVDSRGATVSVFGTITTALTLDVTPTLSVDEAMAVVQRETGVTPGPARPPELVIVPTDAGYRLAWRASTYTANGGVALVVDAHDGAVLERTDAAQRQAAVGTGTGVRGDIKKMSVTTSAGTFLASDALRPPALQTFDLRENLQRTLDFLNGLVTLGPADLAADADNAWDDQATVDAHAYSGWFYDFYAKRFGRRGLDDRDAPIRSLVHPVRRSDVLSQPSFVVGLFYLNAFYAGQGVMVYGEGLPPTVTAGGRHWDYFSGGLDVVAHELTHGVTDYTSRLAYRNESGALNEAFSDMMAVAAEFYLQETGDGPLGADYLIAEDIVTGGIRSLENPAAFGQPDHYSRRALLPLSADNGGVHVNSGIVNQMFYLAIEGGTNRTSGLAVQGVGAANRDQIERAVYRAFTLLLPSTATFSMARAACLQAAADLYGGGSPAVRALAQAWTAVGVE